MAAVGPVEAVLIAEPKRPYDFPILALTVNNPMVKAPHPPSLPLTKNLLDATVASDGFVYCTVRSPVYVGGYNGGIGLAIFIVFLVLSE